MKALHLYMNIQIVRYKVLKYKEVWNTNFSSYLITVYRFGWVYISYFSYHFSQILELLDSMSWLLSLTRSRKLNCTGITLRLDQRRANLDKDNGFVKILASWSWLDQKRIISEPSTTISRTKWKSISTCLVQAWKIGFIER